MTALIWAACTPSSGAVPRYVVTGGSTPAPPYTSWTTAATNIQTAVNACTGGDTVWVSNGLYQAVSGTNFVLINTNITVASVNGPEATILDGGYIMGVA